MIKISGIYEIENEISHKVYVGSAIDILRRWRHHKYLLRVGRHYSGHLQRAWNRDGGQHFVFRVLESIAEHDLLLGREDYWIQFRDCYRAGYNGRPKANSQLGFRHTNESRAKMSVAKKGKPSSRRGFTISEEQKESIRRSKLGKPHTPEHRRNISEGHKGKRRSQEHRWRISEGIRKGRRYHGGIKLTPEHRAKISASLMNNQRARKKKNSPQESLW